MKMAERTTKLESALQELEKQKAYLDELIDLAPEAIVLTKFKEPRTLRINR